MTSGVEPKGRILIVEDDEGCRITLEALLEEEFDVTSVATFREGLRWLLTSPFDVLVTDYELPDGIGLQLLEMSMDPHLVGILVTGQGSLPEITDAVRALKVFRIALKPYDSEILAGWVRSAVRMSRGRRSGFMKKVTLKG